MPNTLDYSVLNNLSDAEREVALQILKEYSDKGSSDTLNHFIYDDYEEIPVEIEEFLYNPKYLGKGLIDDEGRFTVFPYWVDTLKKIFPNNIDTCYNTLALTGAIGLGKSFMAVLCMLYQLYRMMCLKDPYIHYGLQPIDKITFAFMNITLDASKGVGWDKCQQLLQSSEWFMNRGTVSGTTNIVWNPPKGIELIAGSLSRHIIGRAVYSCLDGDTIISTLDGDFPIKELADKPIRVPSYDNDNNIVISDVCTVKPTAISDEEFNITLEDGTVLKCTPNHRFMLTDGTYKEAQYLTTDDEIIEFVPCGYVYRVTNLITGTTYIGQHKSKVFDKYYFGSGIRIQREVKKYGKSNFKIEILCWSKTLEELNSSEVHYISIEKTLNEKCLNLSNGAKGEHEHYVHKPNVTNSPTNGRKCITDGNHTKYIDSSETLPDGWYYGNCHTKGHHNMTRYYIDENARHKNSLSKSGEKNSQYNNGESHKGARNGRYGKPTSNETKLKISKANTGKHYSDEINSKKGRKGVPKPIGFGNKVSKSSIGKHQYTNGIKNIWVMAGEDVPDGFVKGWIR